MLLLFLTVSAAYPQSTPRVLQSLKGVPVHEPSALSRVVTNRPVAIALGKALFWDVQVGSDGKTACATCHFHAGSDARFRNQMSPGLNRMGATSFLFDSTRTGAAAGPNNSMKRADFPFHTLSNPSDRNSTVTYETKDVMGSSGVAARDYMASAPGASEDACAERIDPVFSTGAANFRRVSARHAPTVINAVFNLRNFSDGRANPLFNGVDGFGPDSPGAVIYRGNPPVATRILLDNASLASQATAPPMNDFEMSCSGRTWPELGRRLLKATALKRQAIAADDSVLAGYAAANGQKGLSVTYEALVREAFAADLWNSPTSILFNGKAYSQAEMNFPLFFGLALQLYEATLVSNDAPIDRYFAPYPGTSVANASALTADEIAGMNVFLGKGRCITCHNGPELTSAGTPSRLAAQQGTLVESMIQADGNPGSYDLGYYNIGVRPTADDPGIGGADPWGNPLSLTRRTVTSGRVVVDGAFKTPGLRNIALTGPYFHNGSRASLEEVIEFYNRGGDRRGTLLSDNSGLGANGSNIGPDIRPLSLAEFEKAALVAFLKNALTDERVRWERAPFDHPELPLADGAGFVLVPAVGSAGRAANPLKPFDEILTAGTLGYAAAPMDPLNAPPVVSMAFPAPGAVFAAPATIGISASVFDPDNNLAKVEFFNGAVKLGEVSAAPFTFQWTGVQTGAYAITVRAVDSAGLSASAGVTVNVTAPPQTGPVSTIVNEASGQCVDIHGGVPVPSIPAVLWTCQNAPSQNFRFEALAGGNSVFRIIAVHSGLCLEVMGGAALSLTPVVQQVCNGSAQQQFRLEGQRITPMHSGKALTAIGAALQQSDWIAHASQKWRIGAVQGPAVSITSPASGAVFAAPASVAIQATAANAAKVEFFENSTKLGEDVSAPYSIQWSQAAAGWYTIHARATDLQGRIATASIRLRVIDGVVSTIVNQASGNCLDTMGGRVVQWTCQDGPSQAFRLVPAAANTHTIQAENGSVCFETTGTAILQAPCSGAVSQQFRFEKQSDGAYRITVVASGKALALGASRLEEQVWTGAAPQKWRVAGLP
ncbi:MAG: RICIN domain-containing protein [Bryobacteraceae bacterium]|nr:RICIN domain-containing protein [Bryobacteraceae bacterium]